MAGVGLTLQKPITVFIAALLALLILMSYQVKDESTGRTILGQRHLQHVVSCSNGVIRNLQQRLEHCYPLFRSGRTNKENEKLAKELSELKVRIQADAREKEENKRLRNILNLHEKVPIEHGCWRSHWRRSESWSFNHCIDQSWNTKWR